MGSRPRKLIGTGISAFGILLAVNGLIAGPHAFWLGWESVLASVVAGLLLLVCGILILRNTARPVS